MKQNYGYLIILVTALVGCGGGGSNSETPEQVNTAPQLIGLIDFAIDENTTEITTIQATDAEGDNITYSIEGSDSALMTIGSLSGELSFISPPDYENPQDSNQDNIYEVTIIASKIIYCLMIFLYLVLMMIQYLEIQRDIKVKLLLTQER